MKFYGPSFSVKTTTLLSLALYASLAITKAKAAVEAMEVRDSAYDLDIVQCETGRNNAPTWDDEFDTCLISTCGTKSATHICVQQFSTQTACSDVAAENTADVATAQMECEDDAAIAWGDCSIEIEALDPVGMIDETLGEVIDMNFPEYDEETRDVFGH